MSYIGQQLPADVFSGFVTDSFTGDGSATTFTLSKEPFSEDTLIVVINNVIQKPTTNFTVSGTTLTIVGDAVASGDPIYAIHMGGPLPIGGASELDLNGASDKLILDLDGDTTISADTDDQIDFKAGGTDTMHIINGKVGIGTSSPAKHLSLKTDGGGAAVGIDIHNQGTDAADDSLITFETQGHRNFSLGIDRSENAFVVMSEADGLGTPRIFVDDDGDVRINTTVAIQPGSSSGLGVKGDINISDFTNDTSSSALVFTKSRNTTPGSQTIVNNGDQVGAIFFKADDGNASDYNNNVAAITVNVDAAPGTDDTPGRLQFHTTADGGRTNVERMRIASSGNIGVGQTDTSAAFGISVADTRVTSGVCLDVHHSRSDTTFSGMVARFQSARNTTDGTYQHIRCAISGVANKFIVTDGGTIQAVNTTVTSVSDERIKQDIVDANSQWDDIKALKFKNFKKKQAVRDDGENALKELGVIAQDVESAGMSGLIEMTDPDISHIKSDSTFGTLWTDDDDEVKNGTETAGEVKEVKEKVKTVKYSIIWMKAVKALQEAQARIETLETKVKALEDA